MLRSSLQKYNNVRYCTYYYCFFTVLGRSCAIPVRTDWPVLLRCIKKCSAIFWSIEATGDVSKAIIQKQKESHGSDAGIFIFVV